MHVALREPCALLIDDVLGDRRILERLTSNPLHGKVYRTKKGCLHPIPTPAALHKVSKASLRSSSARVSLRCKGITLLNAPTTVKPKWAVNLLVL